MRRVFLLVPVLFFLAFGVGAEEVEICFNFGCNAHARVEYNDEALAKVGRLLVEASDAGAEREALSYAVAWMYFYAGQQSPIWRDRPGNYDDEEYADGRMDCIDHSTNTTAFLRLLETRGMLRHHSVMEPVRRGRFLTLHWAARIAERDNPDPPGQYTVDTWFFEPGRPAAVFPLRDWLRGAKPVVR